MVRVPQRPLLGALLAIAVTTAMDASGLSAFSALPLLPLAGIFWYAERLPRRSVGLVWGRPRDYALAALYPALVLGAVTLISAAAGAIDVSRADWGKTGRDIAIMASSTIVVALLTEEGFFRGWMWASLERTGLTRGGVLLWSSIAFSLWHLSWVALDTGFDLPPAQVPVYMVNAAAMGAVWGLMRQLSGSVVVSSVSHGLWNGFAYVLFGFGTKVGALGVQETALFGPEVGVVGLALNLLFAGALWRLSTARSAAVVP